VGKLDARVAASAVALGVVGLLAACAPAFAQTASQIVPPSFLPEVSRPGGVVVPGGGGLAAPAGAEKLHVRLSGVRVDGGLPQLAAATEALKARLSGRQVSGAEIFAAARDLEAAYAQAGYVLVRVILPPQHLVNGSTLRLTVVDGFIERVELKGVPETVRARRRHGAGAGGDLSAGERADHDRQHAVAGAGGRT